MGNTLPITSLQWQGISDLPATVKIQKNIYFLKNLKKVKKTVDTSQKPLYNSKASCGTEEFLRRTTVMGS